MKSPNSFPQLSNTLHCVVVFHIILTFLVAVFEFMKLAKVECICCLGSSFVVKWYKRGICTGLNVDRGITFVCSGMRIFRGFSI